jgi:hypothetical protein
MPWTCNAPDVQRRLLLFRHEHRFTQAAARHMFGVYLGDSYCILQLCITVQASTAGASTCWHKLICNLGFHQLSCTLEDLCLHGNLGFHQLSCTLEHLCSHGNLGFHQLSCTLEDLRSYGRV